MVLDFDIDIVYCDTCLAQLAFNNKVMATYKHCVFCASNESCTKEIASAMKTAESLRLAFDLEHDVVECAYHSEIEVIDEGLNTSIWLSNSTLSQLIDDCMRFARERI